MLIFESQSLDVHRNLAMEEYLMDRVQNCGPILYLWRSACAVVMGKNQNPWQECRLDLMAKESVPLARRISGGGTVYHDAGNLNYCIITGREEYVENAAYQLVFQTLEKFGIRAEKTGKSNLSVDGVKFSGNAFAFRKGRVMHHGTLLLKTDLERLNRYLGSMLKGIETHAIASEPAKVMNLGIERQLLAEALKKEFRKNYADGREFQWLEADFDAAVLQEIEARQFSDDWKFGATPAFTLERNGLLYRIRKGEVQNGEFAGKMFASVANSFVC
ncbi:lipoate--protein ligase family protein [Pontiella agarivorans]|uniref:Biotin/lipoate A/B protein ligase family protein n=1 Tax=Pontiella agarivorans TaxID=3038953 RepID=A0ABU5MYB2_9BACT|nr:biotin/lipoate A/B protein ligase family protein [Pontiella agarivorans]MDZ8119160.1 biotin/lipoate A/B protein ligase family protein [Pontiella agarivorans]